MGKCSGIVPFIPFPEIFIQSYTKQGQEEKARKKRLCRILFWTRRAEKRKRGEGAVDGCHLGWAKTGTVWPSV